MKPTPEKIARLEKIRDSIPGTTCQAQHDRIMAALALGTLTTYEITRHLDCYDATARISDLRNKLGERIDTCWHKVVTESGDVHRVALYVRAPTQKGKPKPL